MDRSFTRNTLITFGSQIPIFLFNLGISVIISRILLPEGRGIFTLVMLLPSFLIAITNLGIGSSTVFYVGKEKYPPRQVLGNNLLLTLWLSAVSLGIALVIIHFFREQTFPGVDAQHLLLSLLLIPGLMIMGLALYVLLAIQNFVKYNFILVLRTLISFFCVSGLVWGLRYEVNGALLSEIISLSLASLILLSILPKETGGISFRLNRSYIQDSLRYGIKVHIGNVLYFVYRRINFILINLFLNPAMVGLYSLSIGLTERIWLISDAVGTVLFPRISSEKDEKTLKEFTPTVLRTVLGIIILISILLGVIASWLIILVFGVEFAESVRPFRILLIGITAFCGWRILENDIKGRGRPILNTYIIGFSVILHLSLNLLLIPEYGIEGAAWATTFSYLVTLLVGLIVFCKISGNRIGEGLLPNRNDILIYRTLIVKVIRWIRPKG